MCYNYSCCWEYESNRKYRGMVVMLSLHYLNLICCCFGKNHQKWWTDIKTETIIIMLRVTLHRLFKSSEWGEAIGLGQTKRVCWDIQSLFLEQLLCTTRDILFHAVDNSTEKSSLPSWNLHSGWSNKQWTDKWKLCNVSNSAIKKKTMREWRIIEMSFHIKCSRRFL